MGHVRQYMQTSLYTAVLPHGCDDYSSWGVGCGMAASSSLARLSASLRFFCSSKAVGWMRNPKQRGTNGTWDGGGRYSGCTAKSMCGNEVPKKAPSMCWWREDLGAYDSLQRGQNSLTVASPGRSDRPTGKTRWFSHSTRGQRPKSPACQVVRVM